MKIYPLFTAKEVQFDGTQRTWSATTAEGLQAIVNAERDPQRGQITQCTMSTLLYYEIKDGKFQL